MNSITQNNTLYSEFEDSLEMRLWVDISIEIQSLKPAQVAEECANRNSVTSEGWRSKYYHTWQPKGFDDWWYEKYKSAVKPRAIAKVYEKLDRLLDREADISRIVRAGEFLEGKTNSANIAVGVKVNPDPPIIMNDEELASHIYQIMQQKLTSKESTIAVDTAQKGMV